MHVCVLSALLQKEKADQLIRESKQAQRARQYRQLAYVQATLARTQGIEIIFNACVFARRFNARGRQRKISTR